MENLYAQTKLNFGKTLKLSVVVLLQIGTMESFNGQLHVVRHLASL
jgi:hypothetical protein